MKIILTGGGSGGHFYPIISVAQAINEYCKQEKLLAPELYYLAPTQYDANALFENNITWRRTTAGKMRRYFSLLNFFDIFKTLWGCIKAVQLVYKIYPDVVFGKGGYVSFPVLFAARILNIPVVIHESDSAPGRVNAWAGKFAERIAIGYPESIQYFPKDRTAYTGNPVRRELRVAVREGAHDILELSPALKTILVLGGSQGAAAINDAVLDALPILLEKYQVIHQVGKANIKLVKETAAVILQKSEHKNRYKPYDFLNILNMRMAAGVADLIVSRGGAGSISEIAIWGKPSIIIPIPQPTSHDQTKNAFNYARTGAAVVIEQANLTPHLLVSEVERIFSNQELQNSMAAAAAAFARTDAAELIAKEIVAIAVSHEA